MGNGAGRLLGHHPLTAINALGQLDQLDLDPRVLGLVITDHL